MRINTARYLNFLLALQIFVLGAQNAGRCQTNFVC
jgi:hypothetical protein